MMRHSTVKHHHEIEPLQCAEDAPKISGPDNLSRDGWDEEQCRNFLERILDWVPRNFNYEDGLTIIHPQLQERFGDENVDLACGVLNELIEIVECNPFPGSSYQRWKHTHRNRHENLLLPHVPHTATIMSKVVPTKTLLEWRARTKNSDSLPEVFRVSPTSPTFRTGISTVTHRSAWRIEHTLFVSTGGGKASVYHCPNPEEFHRRLWDPDYGRGGNLVSVNMLTLERPPIQVEYAMEVPMNHRTENKVSSTAGPSTARENQARVQDLQAIHDSKGRRSPFSNMKPPVGFKDAIYEDLTLSRPGPKPGTKPGPACYTSAQNVPLPHGVLVPNAAFARKHHLVQEEVPLPSHLLRGPIQPTAKQLGLANVEYIAKLANIAVRQSRGTPQPVDESKEEDESVRREYFSYFKGPFTADLFYDSGLDFKWSTPSLEQVRYMVPASTAASPSGSKRGLFGLSPSKKQKSPESRRAKKPKSKSSKRNKSVAHQENRRNQLVTVDGKCHLVNAEDSAVRLLSVFRRKEKVSSSNHGHVPSARGDTSIDGSVPAEKSKLNGVGKDGHPIGRVGGDIALDGSLTAESALEIQEKDAGFGGKEEGGKPEFPSTTLQARKSERQTRQSSATTSPGDIQSVEKASTAARDSGEILRPTVFTRPERKPNRQQPSLGITNIDGAADDDSLRSPNIKKAPSLIRVFWSRIEINLTQFPFQNNHSKRKPSRQRPAPGFINFDGAADDDSLRSPDIKKAPSPIRVSWSRFEINLTHYPFQNNRSNRTLTMDNNRNIHRDSAQPSPLRVRKNSVKQIRAATEQRDHNNSSQRDHNNSSHLDHNNSSQRGHNNSSQRGYNNSSERDHNNSSQRDHYNSSQRDHNNSPQRGHNYSSRQKTSSAPTPQSHLDDTSSGKFIPDTSTAILGDFVALTTANMEHQLRSSTDDDIALLNVAARHRFPKPTQNPYNPYEFERSPLLDRLDDESRLAGFRNFVKEQEVQYVPSPQPTHDKNSHSAENARYMMQEPLPTRNLASKPSRHNFQRSESSPTISHDYPRHIPQYAPSESHYDSEEEGFEPRGYRKRGAADDADDGALGIHQGVASRPGPSASSSAHRNDRHPRREPSHSPTRQRGRRDLHKSFSSSSNYTRNSKSSVEARSSSSTNNQAYTALFPEKQLHDVSELDEAEGRTPRGPMASDFSTTKRSRSPMKKMFGENGWLSHSPIVKQDSKISPLPKKAVTPKKSTMIEKIKHKFGEMAEKADISPMFRSNTEKNSRETQSFLLRSIEPFEQARIYAELELMMVHTANVFLMNEFSQARIAIESIRKTIDTWKSKGRPMVTEFMYDQITQQNLVALNHPYFRFHGPEANNEIRISSMLYSWKQVAKTMAVRTFCDADSVLLKLLFDIEHILELLGAGEPFMLRLQDISKGVKDTIQLARYKKQMEEAQKHAKGQQQAGPSAPRGSLPLQDRPQGSHYSDSMLRDPYHG